MNKTLRGTFGAVAVSASLLAVAVLPASALTVKTHAFVIDAIMKNDLNLKALPPSTLHLGGSSFDAILVQAAETKWNLDTGKAPFASYDATKSGTGRANAISGAYNIGFSDFPLNQSSVPDVGVGSSAPSDSLANYVQIPVALGGVAPIYNMGSLATNQLKVLLHSHPLVLSGLVLGKIFKGSITYWDNAAISSLNPGLKVGGVTTLPHQKINIVSRTSGSGTTFVFTDYLSRVDHADFPAATSAAFAAAASTQGTNALVDAGVHAIDGGIGYVEYGYAVANNTPTASMVNKSGKVVALTATGVLAAATAGIAYINAHGGFKLSSLNNFSINNGTGATVYPIAGFSFAIVKKNQTVLKTGIAVVKFLDFLSHQGGGTGLKAKTFGQDLALSQGYVPMPASLGTVARNFLKQVTNAGHPILSATN